jgi:flagellar basal body-associated protein FliL
MADKDTENKTVEKEQTPGAGGPKIGLIMWVVMAIIIMVLSASGFIVGRLVADSAPPESETPENEVSQVDPKPSTTKGTWYYNELKSVVVNPDEPGATRFVRVSLILEVSNELAQDEAKDLIQAKSPLLINWLNLYFKGLTLDQMQTEKDMKRILSQIRDGFNEVLFSNTKPQIVNVLIGEFNIQ